MHANHFGFSPSDLKKSQRFTLMESLYLQECATLEGSKNGLQSRLSEQELATSQLKQDLVRVTLAKQTLEYEKKELLRRVDELERGLTGVKNENGEKDKLIRAAKQQIEEFARKQRDFNLAASAAGVSSLILNVFFVELLMEWIMRFQGIMFYFNMIFFLLCS